MQGPRLWLLFLALLSVGVPSVTPAAQPSGLAPPQQQAPDLILSGRIVEMHAPQVFTMREDAAEGRELLVVAPRPLSSGLVGAAVTVGGVLRRFSEAELRQTPGWAGLDVGTRQRLASRPVLLASSVMAIAAGKPRAAVPPPQPSPPPLGDPRVAEAEDVPRAPLSMRLAMLAANPDEFAGQPVRVLQGHVVGVLEPGAFLIEPATRYLKAMGQRDRVLVLIEAGSLRVPAGLVVGSSVIVTGVARTLVSMQVTGEVPWPARLRPEIVERLEVRAALLATSVQTAEGTELTDRPPAPAR